MLKRLIKHQLSVGIDLDGVCIDGDSFLRYIFKMDFNKDFTLEDLKPKDKPGELYTDYVTQQQLEWAVDSLHQHYTVSQIEMIPKAKEYIKKLAKEFNIKFITNRPESAKNSTNLLLERHKLYYNSIHFTVDKTKHIHDIFVMLEDNWNNANAICSLGVPVILFEYPWGVNKGKDHPLMIRIKGPNFWEQAYPLIKELATKAAISSF